VLGLKDGAKLGKIEGSELGFEVGEVVGDDVLGLTEGKKLGKTVGSSLGGSDIVG